MPYTHNSHDIPKWQHMLLFYGLLLVYHGCVYVGILRTNNPIPPNVILIHTPPWPMVPVIRGFV